MNKKLVRTKDDVKIAGVCNAYGKFFKLDTTLVRVVFLIGIFVANISMIVYIISFLLIPVDKG